MSTSDGMKRLDNADAQSRRYLQRRPRSNTKRALLLKYLTIALLEHFRELRRTGDLEEAIARFYRRLDLCQSDSASTLNDLAVAIFNYLKQLGYSKNLEDAVVRYRQSLCFRGHLDRSASFDDLANAISTGFRLAGNNEALEGAIALFCHALTLHPSCHHPLHRLWDIDASPADVFGRISRGLGDCAVSSDIETPESDDEQSSVPSERDELIQRLKQLDGFADFLRPVPFSSLQSAAREGPVVNLNVSQYRSDAIIIQPSSSPVLVPLPNASPDALRGLSQGLSSALTQDRDRDRAIRPMLGELWDCVVSPVVDQLTALGVAEKSRIWWCPTSEFSGLPLHAAGPYQSGQKNLPDIYTSSYTPTLSTLIRARSDAPQRLSVPKLLVMGQPDDNNSISGLPSVREEIRRIHCLGKSVDVLLGEQATRNTLLQRLHQNPWVHFACHGRLAVKAPFLSHFQLHNNERLTLEELIKARFSDAELAFLSACHSAAIDVKHTPDEAINLAVAMQFCGFRSVVGTMWAMVDVDGPDVAADFYGYMFREPGSAGDFRDSAVALNHATREMRKRGVPMDRWINFVHIGA